MVLNVELYYHHIWEFFNFSTAYGQTHTHTLVACAFADQ